MHFDLDNLEKKRKELQEKIGQFEAQKKFVRSAIEKLTARYNIGEIKFDEYKEEYKRIFKDKTPEQWTNYYNIQIKSCNAQLDWYDSEIRKARSRFGKKALAEREKEERQKAIQERIQTAEGYKKSVIGNVQELVKKYNARELTYEQYQSETKKLYQGNEPQKLVDYYDDYIKKAKSLSSYEPRKSKVKTKLIMVLPLLLIFGLAIFFLFGFVLRPQFTGLTVEMVDEVHTTTYNAVLNESTIYDFDLSDEGSLNWIKFNGAISKKGTVKVYLDDILILDSADLESDEQFSVTGSLISGFASEGSDAADSGTDPSSEGADSGSSDGGSSTEQASESSGTESSGEESAGSSGEEPTGGPSAEEGSQTGEISGGTETMQTGSETGSNESNESPNEETNETEQEPAGKNNETETAGNETVVEEPGEETEIVEKIKLENYCKESCDLKELGLNKSSYKLRIEIENAEFELGELNYEISVEKEAGVEENATITEPPVMTKEIPNIVVGKNGYYELDVNEYFTGASEYYLKQTDNLSTSVSGSVIRIQPSENFIGIRESRIVVVNEFGSSGSNLFNITVSENESAVEELLNITGNATFNLTTRQYKAIINRPVKWVKKIELGNLEDAGNLILEIPKESTNISIKTGEEAEAALQEAEDYEEAVNDAEREEIVGGGITGNVVSDLRGRKGIVTRIIEWFKGFGITGNVISEDELGGRITESSNSKIIDVKKIAEQTNENEIAVEYYTQAPGAIEEDITRGKRITVSAPDELGYTDILAYTALDNSLQMENSNSLKVYWHASYEDAVAYGYINETKEKKVKKNTEEGTEENIAEEDAEENVSENADIGIANGSSFLTGFAVSGNDKKSGGDNSRDVPVKGTQDYYLIPMGREVYDIDGDGRVDYVEWVVPHLSNQTFEIIITDAEHLDENKNFVENIFDYVNEIDGINYNIPENHYARAYFERELTSDNVIDIVVNSSNSTTIEVYEKDSNVLVGKMENVTQGFYYTSLNFSGSQSVFDLKSVGGDVNYDYIHDAAKTLASVAMSTSPSGNMSIFVGGNFTMTCTPACTGSGSTPTVTNNYVYSTTAWCAGSNININSSGVLTNLSVNPGSGASCGATTATIYANSAGTVYVRCNSTEGTRVAVSPQCYNITVSADTAAPNVNITYPLNITYNINVSALNYTVSDTDALSACWYSLNGGAANTTITCGDNVTGLTSTEGSNTWKVWANDSANNVNVSSVTFLKDTAYPIFSAYYDNNATLTGSGTGLFNVTLTNTNGTVFLEINNTNYTALNVTSNVYNVSVSLTNGTYSYYWGSWGNGTSYLYNTSGMRSYTVNASSATGTNVWISASAQLFTNATAWSLGRVPVAGDDVIFNGTGIGSVNITNNTMPQDLNSFTVENNYPGKIYFAPLFAVGTWGSNAGTLLWNVTNNINISNGTMYVYGDGYNITETWMNNPGMHNITDDGHGQEWRSVNGNITIEANGKIEGVGLGFGPWIGPGAQSGKSGTYGGRGNLNTADPYGNATAPTSLGSGGDCVGAAAIKLDSQNIELNGQVNMSGASCSADSASGGSIWIKSNSIVGNGVLRADSGSSGIRGGGGGRIRLEYGNSMNYTGTTSMMGARVGTTSGREGTLTFTNNTWPSNWDLKGNIGLLGGNYGDGSVVNILGDFNTNNFNVTIYGDCFYNKTNPITCHNTTSDGKGIWLNASGNITISSSSMLDGIGLGFPASTGPGTSTGGSYGGKAVTGGSTYGNETMPVSLGSGGGTSGGSAVTIEALGFVRMDGKINVSGTDNGGAYNGAGGSIWIKASNITGTGVLIAVGGGIYGGGGGGRIALTSTNIIDYGGIILNTGGISTSNKDGSGGTVYINASTSIIISGNISVVGRNGTSGSGQTINVTAPLLTLSGIYNASRINQSVAGTSEGRITLNYTDCSSNFTNAVFNPDVIWLNTTACGGGTTYSLYLPSYITSNFQVNGSVNVSLVNGSSYTDDQFVNFTNATYGKRLQIYGQFSSGNVDLTNMTLNMTDTKTVVDLSTVSGIATNHTIFIPNNRNAGVDICPSAKTLSDLNVSCPNKLSFSYAELSAGTWKSGILASVEGTLYKIENLTGSGGGEDFTPPNINFTNPTLSNGTAQTANSIYVNVSSSDASDHYTFADFDRNVLLWMRMDDTNSSGDPTDISSWSNNGSKVGGAVINSTSGKFGNGTYFDGSNDLINVSNSASLAFNAAGNYTWSMWVYPTTVDASHGGILQKCVATGSGQKGYSIYLENQGGVKLFFGDCGWVATTYAGPAVSLNTWTHLAISYSNKKFTFYKNGVGSAGSTISGFTSENQFPLYVGQGVESANTGATLHFSGMIDDVSIFNRNLSSQEVAALYNATANQYYNNFTNLVSGAHTFTGYAVDAAGNKNQTEERTVTIDTTIPQINFTNPTPSNGSSQSNTDIYVNVSSSDSSQHYTFVDFDNDLFLRYTMDDVNSSGDPTDLSFNSYNGSRVGAASQTSNGYFGKGFSVDGPSSVYVAAPTISNMNFTINGFTHSMWAKFDSPPSAGQTDYVDYVYAGTSDAFFFRVAESLGTYSLSAYGEMNNDAFTVTKSGMSLAELTGGWHHLISVYNKTDVIFYVDGVEIGSDGTSNVQTDTNFELNFFGYDMTGKIDDVLLFNRSFSSQEVLAMYDASANQYYRNFTGLADGAHTIKGYTIDRAGNKNQTETRMITVVLPDTTPPNINFTNPTPTNASTQTWNSIYVNVSTNDSSEHYAFVDFDKSLLLWMRMDDLNASNDPYDLSSWSNNGSKQGNAAQSSSGAFGESFTFDGNGDYILVKNESNLAFNATGNYTWSAWVYPIGITQGVTNTGGVFGKCAATAGSNQKGYSIYLNPGRNVVFGDCDYTATVRTSTGTVTLNQWNHVLVNYTNKAMTFYINGVASGSGAPITSLGSESTFNLTIGSGVESSASGVTLWFNGSIDDAMIFNRSLSISEISALYNASANQYYNNFTGLSSGGHNFTGYAVDTAGNKNQTEQRQVTVDLSAAPTIPYVSAIADTNPIENNATPITFVATVNDANGASDINVSSVNANFTRVGEALRQNLTCVNLSGQDTATSKNFSCSIEMWYFDYAGNWNITIGASDQGGLGAVNGTTTFSYGSLSAMVLSPNNINFGNAGSSQANVIGPYTQVNNTGNYNATNLSIMGMNLLGQDDSSVVFAVENFTAGTDPAEGSPPPSCNVAGGTATRLINGSYVNITGSSLLRGNHSVNDNSTGQENIYYCIPSVPNLPTQAYSTYDSGTSQAFEWTIKIALAVFVRKLKRKKNRKEILSELKKRLRGELGIEKLALLDEKLKEEQGVSLSEMLSDVRREKEALQIPIDVFRQDIGPSEALCKYLKENVGFNYSEIADALNRDDRTVWINYRNAANKKAAKTRVRADTVYVPISVFKDRRLSVLEAVVNYFRNRGLTNVEIARLLGKDPRNIWTLYSRAARKLQK